METFNGCATRVGIKLSEQNVTLISIGSTIHYTLGVTLSKQGRHQEAIAAYHRSAALLNRHDDNSLTCDISCALALSLVSTHQKNEARFQSCCLYY